MTRRRILVLWVCLLFVTAAILTVWKFRKPGAPLTRVALRDARELWLHAGISRYTMDVVVSGAQNNHLHMEAEGGKVVSMKADESVPPTTAWGYWTVEGMFDFLEKEIDSAESPKTSYGLEDGKKVVIQAYFDPKIGIPKTFFRYIKEHPSNIQWEITRFDDNSN